MKQRPIVCLVTDRQRAAPGASSFPQQHRALIALIADAADAGVDLIHIREHDLCARDLAALVADAVAVTRGSTTRVVVGDRADVAIAADADGVHLPAAGVPIARARELGPRGWVIGRAAHSADEVTSAAVADYVVFGTVFATASKPGLPGQGTEALAAAATRARVPVLAIGGITIDRISACAAAGAAGVAAISLFLPAERGGIGTHSAVRLIRERFAAGLT